MTIYTRTRTRQSLLEEYVAPHMDVLGMDWGETLLHSPKQSTDRLIELRTATEGAPVGVGGFETGMGELRPTSPMVDASTARSRVSDEGLDLTVPDNGIRRDALDILIDRKKAERRRMDLHNRAPGGLAFGAVRFGTMLGASMMDPLNIASAFVPVVGHARYAQMVGRFGATRGRMMAGAIEGAAGAAIVEPVVIGAATHEQSDYDLTDSMLNIALGTALGGGLHVGTGAIGDAMARRANRAQGASLDPLPAMLDELPFETREAALRTSVAQAMSGRNIDVDPVLRMGGAAEARFGPEMRVAADMGEAPPTPERLLAASREDYEAEIWAEMNRRWDAGETIGYSTATRRTEISPANRGAVRFRNGRIETYEGKRKGKERWIELGGTGMPLDTVAAQLGLPTSFERSAFRAAQSPETTDPFADIGITAEQAQFQIARVLAEIRGTNQIDEANALASLTPDDLPAVMERLGEWAGDVETWLQQNVPELFEAAPIAEAQPAARRPVDIQAAARANHAPENVRLADFDAARAADERIAETPADDSFPEASLDDAVVDLHDTLAGIGHELMTDLRAKMLREANQGAPTKARQPKSLFQFLADEGGIRDQGGELKAMNLEKTFIPGRGKLVRKAKGLTLDEARRRAVEAGYIFDPGDVSGGEAQTTIDDLLQALSEEAGGNKVFSRFDDLSDMQAREAHERAREDIARAVDEVAGVLTSDIPESMKRMAVEIRLREGLDPEDALERAIMLDEAADDTGTVLRYDDGDEVPFDEFPPFDPGRAAEQRGPVSGDGDGAPGQGRAAEPTGDEPGVPGRAEGEPRTESTSIGEQFVVPGAGRENIGATLQRRTEQPLRAGAAQRLTMDEGLFGDESRQQDMFDAVMQEVEAMAEAMGDPDLVTREMRDAQTLADSAETYGKAVRAAANCQTRRGDA